MLNVRRFVDLSMAITARTPVYPGDPEPRIKVFTTLARDGYNLHELYLGSQTGTHCDAPFHFKDDGATIEQMDLGLFFGPGVVVRVTDKPPEGRITLDDVRPYEARLTPGTIVLFNTNWYRRAGTEEFFRHPYLTPDAALYLLDRGIRTVAIDAINIDPTGGTEFPVHDIWAAANGIIAENLANADRITAERFYLALFPLKLVGGDGAPCRAVALEVD